jgi:hypothetical protein
MFGHPVYCSHLGYPELRQKSVRIPQSIGSDGAPIKDRLPCDRRYRAPHRSDCMGMIIRWSSSILVTEMLQRPLLASGVRQTRRCRSRLSRSAHRQYCSSKTCANNTGKHSIRSLKPRDCSCSTPERGRPEYVAGRCVVTGQRWVTTQRCHGWRRPDKPFL